MEHKYHGYLHASSLSSKKNQARHYLFDRYNLRFRVGSIQQLLHLQESRAERLVRDGMFMPQDGEPMKVPPPLNHSKHKDIKTILQYTVSPRGYQRNKRLSTSAYIMSTKFFLWIQFILNTFRRTQITRMDVQHMI